MTGRHARALFGWAVVVPMLAGLSADVPSAPAPAAQRDAAAGEALFQANCARVPRTGRRG